jgi:2-keto-4-pentenoate hydratase/2-oxohepta-3-ene-1,7-dioic acid hydratase in catechol pathway
MRFVTFEHDGFARAGVLDPSDGGRILDLADDRMAGVIEGPPFLAGLLAQDISEVARRIAAARSETGWLATSEARLLAPLPQPPRIIAAAHNYRDALAERGLPLPDAPNLFLKSPASVIGPGEAVRLPPGIGGVTWEAELAVVIGRPVPEIPAVEARDYIAGYFVFNDVSASEIIRADGNFERGKNFPTFAPCGPWFVTADEIPDPQTLRVRFTLNGETMQDSTTAQMLFGIADLISRLSKTHGLGCGDVIATGTPAGVGAARKPPRWIAGGDTMVAEVEGLGQLVNPVVEERTNG